MNQATGPMMISRRNVLKGVGWAAVAAALNPIQPIWSWAGSRQPLKIGVLLPQSRIYPDLGANLLAGMRLYFEQGAEHEVTLLAEDTGLWPSGAIRKSRKLLGEDKVDLVVGLVSSKMMVWLHDLYREHQTPLIVSNMGADVPRRKDLNRYIFHHSFNKWQATWLLGSWAAKTIGQKAMMVASLYDSGYDSFNAFRYGFEEGGGKIIDSQVAFAPSGLEKSAETVVAELAKSKADVVYACFCGKAAVSFVKAYHEAGLDKQMPLLGAPFLADQRLWAAQGKAAEGIKSAFAWAKELQTPANKAFVTAVGIFCVVQSPNLGSKE